ATWILRVYGILSKLSLLYTLSEIQSGQTSVDSSHVHLLHLITVAHMVQILLTFEAAMDQDSGATEEEELTCQLYNTLRKHLGSVLPDVSSGWQLLHRLKVGILPFLRAAALFFHYLNSSVPPTDLMATSVCPPTCCCFTKCVCQYRWCRHPVLKQTLQGGQDFIRFPRESNKLIDLPEDYSVLINQASSFTCPRSGGDKSRAPTLCLVCGAMLCSQSYCCQVEVDGEDVGACTAHTFTCGAGVGLFLRVRESQVLFVAGKTKGCFYPPPFLDDYGETDQGLKRGNPLHLCLERYRKIERLWRQHGIPEVIGHAQEANQTLVAIDWQHL
uniref:E3 ubiquitin-protein ligase n=1 Tax=Oryzias latipes TaxID=8090 RepID=A0A3P9L224_ORYLA